MENAHLTPSQQIGAAASVFQLQSTGHAPGFVTVVLSEDTLVVTLHEALTPAEKSLSQTPLGAAQVQEFHRRLFSDSSESLCREIERILGRKVCEAAAEIEIETGNVVHAFTTGAMVQVILLTPETLVESAVPKSMSEAVAQAEDDGLRVPPNSETTDTIPANT